MVLTTQVAGASHIRLALAQGDTVKSPSLEELEKAIAVPAGTIARTPGLATIPTPHRIRDNVRAKPFVKVLDFDGAAAGAAITPAQVISFLISAKSAATLIDVNQGKPYTAITWNVSTVAWSAGAGWPTYSDYCPRNDISAGMHFKDLRVHQVAACYAGSDGQLHVIFGCSRSGSLVLPNDAPFMLYFGVNDDLYSDNSGGIQVDISSYTPA